MSTANPPTVIVLGAAFTGIPIAHKLLRSLPAEYKLILVNPSTHLYWNFAAPRVVVKDDQFSNGNAAVFESIIPGFASHPATRFEFVQGKAVALDPKANTVVVTPTDDEGTEGTQRSIVYTHLVIATGSSAQGDWPFKSVGSLTATQNAIKDVRLKIEAAKTIVLSGAGATGVETTGEVATLFKGSGKKIFLLSFADRPLPKVRADVGKEAQKQLESLGVVVKNNVRVTKETEKDGVKLLALSDGETIQADLHIPTYGSVPNTQFMPAELLDGTRNVKVSSHMQSTEYANIWASGDVAAVKQKNAISGQPMLETLVHNLLATVQGKGKDTFKEYKDEDTPLFVPVGGGFAMGTGIWGSWKIWGFLVWLTKGRSYLVGRAKNFALGKKFLTGGNV